MRLDRILGSVLFIWTLTATAAEPTPAELFSRSAEYFDVKISPDGSYLSVKTSRDGKDVLVILNINTMQPMNMVAFPANAEVGNYAWANNERLVFQKVYKKGWTDVPQYYGELMAMNADGSKTTYLFGYNSGEQQTGSHIKKNTAIRATAFILDPLPDDERYMLVNAFPWDQTDNSVQDVYRVDLYKGTRRKITGAPIGNAQFMTDHQGDLRFVSGQDRKNITKVFYRKDGDWLNTDKLNLSLSDFSPISFADDKNSVYAAGREQGKTSAVYKIDLETGDKQKIIQDETVDPSNFWINQESKQLYAVEFEAGHPSYAFVSQEESHTKLLKELLAALPGHQVRIVSETRDSGKLVILAFNDRNPGDYYLFDTKTLKLGYLVSMKKWLDPELMAEVKPISFTGRDGTQLHGYLTLPHGKEAKDLPLVVNPHGGPHFVRDRWEFNEQNQLLASQGMAVLQVNFRGSGGYGAEFQKAGYRKWGTDIQHDIIDATRYVVEQGIVDKDRVCIAGGSFGGYSALQSAIMEPDLFKCAIGAYGVYDLEMIFDEGIYADRASSVSFFKEVLGEDPKVLQAMSPVHHVDKLKTPLMLVHGGDDPIAPIEQFEAMEKALKARNYPYQKLLMDNEGHGFYKDEHRAEEFEAMLGFLKANLKL
jgi:dipeptidyl aminopeptidase/acylaminoacyl peptidase